MTSVPIRDPLADHLITPQNAALIVVNYQQNQFRSVRSMDSDLLVENVFSTAKLAKRFGLPIVHSTVGVAAGQDQSTLPELADLLGKAFLSGRLSGSARGRFRPEHAPRRGSPVRPVPA